MALWENGNRQTQMISLQLEPNTDHHHLSVGNALLGDFCQLNQDSALSRGEEAASIADDTGYDTYLSDFDLTSQEGDDEREPEVEEQPLGVDEDVEEEQQQQLPVVDKEEQEVNEVVRTNYPALLKKYFAMKPRIATMQDPFNEVHYLELCKVLEQSAERSGLVTSAELMDIAIQILGRQVDVTHRSFVSLVDELTKSGRKRKANAVEGNQKDENISHPQPANPMNGEKPHQERTPPSPAPLHEGAERRYRWIDADQVDYSFMNELSAQIVTRRKKLYGHLQSITQNPYLDFQVNIYEYYEQLEAIETENSIDSLAPNLIQDMGTFGNAHAMGILYVRAPFLGRDDTTNCMMEMDDISMDVGAGIGLADVAANNENVEPQAFHPTDVTFPTNLHQDTVVEMEVGAEGENAPPMDKGKRGHKKRRKRRVPLGEQQNMAQSGEDMPIEMKRAHLDDHVEQLHLSVNDEGCPNGSEWMDPLQQSTMIMGPGDDNLSDLEVTAADEVHFRPPSPLSMQNSPFINFSARACLVDMSSVKAKFHEIVTSGPAGITFVDILKKSEMNILVDRNECIRQNVVTTSTSEISVGVAFLAMLHNASNDKFYLKEDPDGAFKVSTEKPLDLHSNCDV